MGGYTRDAGKRLLDISGGCWLGIFLFGALEQGSEVVFFSDFEHFTALKGFKDFDLTRQQEGMEIPLNPSPPSWAAGKLKCPEVFRPGPQRI